MQVDLNELDIKNLLAIINKATINGEQAETITLLKRKLKSKPTPPVEPPSEG